MFAKLGNCTPDFTSLCWIYTLEALQDNQWLLLNIILRTGMMTRLSKYL